MNRIRQLRLAKGFSLEKLAGEMGGLVTKQALSKYEKDSCIPSPTVAARLAAALGVKALQLWSDQTVNVEFAAYRRLACMGKKKKAEIEAVVGKSLEDRFRLQERLGLADSFQWMSEKRPLKNAEDAEKAAERIRLDWGLGFDAIADLMSILENRLIHCLEIECGREFDGISALAKNDKEEVVAVAVTTRKVVSGDRQRMNLAHELGHLVLRLNSGINEEKAAFRFAGAFLLPGETLRKEIGESRANLQLTELLALKRRFGISLQALLHRLCDLNIISTTTYKSWMIDIGQKGWRKEEPEPIALEKSTWLERMLTRALAEGIVTIEEAKNIGGEIAHKIGESIKPSRAAFLRLSIEQRKRALEEQAKQAQKYYSSAMIENDLETGEIIDHDSK